MSGWNEDRTAKMRGLTASKIVEMKNLIVEVTVETNSKTQRRIVEMKEEIAKTIDKTEETSEKDEMKGEMTVKMRKKVLKTNDKIKKTNRVGLMKKNLVKAKIKSLKPPQSLRGVMLIPDAQICLNISRKTVKRLVSCQIATTQVMATLNLALIVTTRMEDGLILVMNSS